MTPGSDTYQEDATDHEDGVANDDGPIHTGSLNADSSDSVPLGIPSRQTDLSSVGIKCQVWRSYPKRWNLPLPAMDHPPVVGDE